MPPKPPTQALDPNEQPTRRVRDPLPATVEQLPRLIGVRDPALVNHVLAMSARMNELDEHIVEIGASMVLGFARIERRLDGEELPPHPHRNMRGKLPSLSEYNPDYTPAGGLRLDQDGFQKLQEKIAAQDRRAELAEAKKKGAEEALAALEVGAARFRTRVLFVIAVATPVAGLLGWLAHQFIP
jgi:hypothetical protein